MPFPEKAPQKNQTGNSKIRFGRYTSTFLCLNIKFFCFSQMLALFEAFSFLFYALFYSKICFVPLPWNVEQRIQLKLTMRFY